MFERAANIKTGEYLEVLLAAFGAGLGGPKRSKRRYSNNNADTGKVDKSYQSERYSKNLGKTAQDSSKNERKGDQGRSKIKYDRQIEQLQNQVKTLQGREKRKVLEKIKKMKKIAQKKRKGEEHSRIGKQGRRR